MKWHFLLVLLLVAATAVGCSRRAAVFEIPQDYVGWVTVEYDDDSCETGPQTFFTSVVRVQPDGSACSKTWSGEGLTRVHYYYVDHNEQRTRRLESTGWGEGGEIWAQAADPEAKERYFFVGDESEFKATTTGPYRLGEG